MHTNTITASITKSREVKGYRSNKTFCEVFTVVIGRHEIETMFTADDEYVVNWLGADYLRPAADEAGGESILVGFATFRGIHEERWGVTTVVLCVKEHCLVYTVNGKEPVDELKHLFERADVLMVGLNSARDVGDIKNQWKTPLSNSVDLLTLVKSKYSNKNLINEGEVCLEELARLVLPRADVEDIEGTQDKSSEHDLLQIVAMSSKLENSHWLLVPGEPDLEKIKLATVTVFLSLKIANRCL